MMYSSKSFIPKIPKHTASIPIWDFRLIHGINGTITPFRIDFPFPVYNFCPSPNGVYSFVIYRFDEDKMLILYVNSTDVNLASYYGLVAEKGGKIIRFVIALIFIVKKYFSNFFFLNP